MQKITENNEFSRESLAVGENSLIYNTQETGETGNIKTVIPNISDKYIKSVEILKGKMLVNTQDKQTIAVAQNLGIAVNPYDIVDGELLSSTGNLLLMDSTGTLVIPASVTKIGEGAFANLDGLKTIIIPGTVKEIANNAFSYNSTLEKVIMQDGVEKIGNNAFSFCRTLKEVEMPNSITTMGGMVFYDCKSLEKINISSKLKELPSNTFSDCTSLLNITLPEGIKTLASSAFAGTSISKIDIPSTVTNISSTAFRNCDNLSNIELKNNKKYSFSNGVLSTISGDQIIFITSSKLKESSVFEIPEGVTSFNYALQAYTNIKKLIIPSTLNSLTMTQGTYLPSSIEEIEVASENERFVAEDGILYTKDDNKLILCYSKDTNITIKEGITNFGSISFVAAANAKTITLPSTAQSLGYMIFTNGPSTENIMIGKNVTDIDPMFKYGKTSGTVTISEYNPNYMVENNTLYSKDKKMLITVLNRINGSYTIESGVETIQDSAFHNQYNMTEVIIPDSVKEIKKSFIYCTALTTITIPASVEKIGSTCFSYCKNLSEIIINKPEGTISGSPWGATKGAKVVKWENT